MKRSPFELKPFPRERHDVVDALEIGVRRHMVHALLELDVTYPRQLLRDHESNAGARLSFTAFIVAVYDGRPGAWRGSTLGALVGWKARAFTTALSVSRMRPDCPVCPATPAAIVAG
jgi:hypothetical protein